MGNALGGSLTFQYHRARLTLKMAEEGKLAKEGVYELSYDESRKLGALGCDVIQHFWTVTGTYKLPEAAELLWPLNQDADALPHRQLIVLTPEKLSCTSVRGRFMMPSAKNSGSIKISSATVVNRKSDEDRYGDRPVFDKAVEHISAEDYEVRPLFSRGYFVYETLPVIEEDNGVVDLKRSQGPDTLWLNWAMLRFPKSTDRGHRGKFSTKSVDLAPPSWTKFERVLDPQNQEASEA